MSDNIFQPPAPKSDGAVAPIEQHRAISETQGAMIIAKRFPRDQHAAFTRIMAACDRPTLAASASYAYPKGKQMVTGPSIRLAEVLAQNWGNMQFGIRELSQDNGESEVEAFCWDIETNTRQIKVFKVPHLRDTKNGPKKLESSRDVYEHVANQGARRLRACILGVIPGDIVDAAIDRCEKTLKKGSGKTLQDRVRDMLVAFESVGVTKEMIEARVQHKTTAIVEQQVIELGKIFNSIKDGMSAREDWFEVPKAAPSKAADNLMEKLNVPAPTIEEMRSYVKNADKDDIDAALRAHGLSNMPNNDIDIIAIYKELKGA